MKKQAILALALVLSFVLGGVAMAYDVPDSWPATSTVGVVPVEDADWKTGDAGQECVLNLGYDFGLKIDEWNSDVGGSYSGACDDQGSCELAPEYNNTIAIPNNDGVFFDWEASPFALGAVVVKASTKANIFYYDPAAYLDTDLYSVVKTDAVYENGIMIEEPTFYDISHASFCWDLQDQGLCYQDETAWAVGADYNDKGGNWAMYVAYDGANTVDIRADGGDGVGMAAGTVTFSEAVDGEVTITIELADGWIFYYDLNDDEEDNNIKVQDYANAPKGNPKVGKFDWKAMAPVGSTSYTITVPDNSYYGVHLDLAYEVPCD